MYTVYTIKYSYCMNTVYLKYLLYNIVESRHTICLQYAYCIYNMSKIFSTVYTVWYNMHTVHTIWHTVYTVCLQYVQYGVLCRVLTVKCVFKLYFF